MVDYTCIKNSFDCIQKKRRLPRFQAPSCMFLEGVVCVILCLCVCLYVSIYTRSCHFLVVGLAHRGSFLVLVKRAWYPQGDRNLYWIVYDA